MGRIARLAAAAVALMSAVPARADDAVTQALYEDLMSITDSIAFGRRGADRGAMLLAWRGRVQEAVWLPHKERDCLAPGDLLMLGVSYQIDGPVETDWTRPVRARIEECIAHPPRPEPKPVVASPAPVVVAAQPPSPAPKQAVAREKARVAVTTAKAGRPSAATAGRVGVRDQQVGARAP